MKHKYESGNFLENLGKKVRTLRLASGRSIQELAEEADLSPRFLAQLEAGRGNISVARLARLAGALDESLHSLIPTGKQEVSLRSQVWELVESCPVEDLEELYNWLSRRQKKRIPRSVALVGVRGAGKSTIGKMLARRLGIPFVEIDAMVEAEAGISLVELFAIHGESYYRQVEHDVMRKFLATSPRVVFATGGSLVTARETWGIVLRQCHTVWLKARARDHLDRVAAQGDIRPMRNNPSAMDELKAMLKSREPLYSQAALTVDTSKYSPEQSVSLILQALADSLQREEAGVPAHQRTVAPRSSYAAKPS
ncbi:MAG: helix-turn-helix domain-containing protein [Acidobacteria bacterium]|nr:helix-turn-helix domain-containing protein [Acidobacteriota bacterium]